VIHEYYEFKLVSCREVFSGVPEIVKVCGARRRHRAATMRCMALTHVVVLVEAELHVE
jgi:hypothetical protein